MIGIRVDANEIIASGHVMRCLSLADALISLREEVLFFTADEFGAKIIQERDHRVICLHSDWNDMDGEPGTLLPLLREHKPDLLLVDSYQVTADYLSGLQENIPLVYMDDLAAFDYPADLVINYAIGATREDYPAESQASPAKAYILGPSYAPLRKQFLIPEDELEDAVRKRKEKKQILITTGAADPQHVAKKAVRAILAEPELDGYCIIVVKGRFWDNEALPDAANDRIRVYTDVSDMASLMKQSTFAVSAGGSTLYELTACLVPTVTVQTADNQKTNIEGFAKFGLMPCAGDAREDTGIGEKIADTLLSLVRDGAKGKDIEEKMKKTGVKDGALRLANALITWQKSRILH